MQEIKKRVGEKKHNMQEIKKLQMGKSLNLSERLAK
jgi:hypothetical protein